MNAKTETVLREPLITFKYVATGVVLLTFFMMFTSSVRAESEQFDNYYPFSKENKELIKKDGWRQYKSNSGIIADEREMPGSDYIKSRAEAIIDAPIEVLLEVLNDIPSYPLWMYECKEAKLLNQETETKRKLYYAQGVPFFGSADRDVLIEASITEDLDNGTYVISLQKVDDDLYLRPKDGDASKRQWMDEFDGVWDLKMINRNQTKVVYSIFTSPGGFAPGFIANSVTRDVSFYSLKGMRSKVKEKVYIEKAEDSAQKARIDAAIEEGRLKYTVSNQ